MAWEDCLEEPDLDTAFLERDRLRKAGRPVEIARTDRLLLRETILSDVPKLYEMGGASGSKAYLRPVQPTLEKELEVMEAYIRFAYAFYDFGLWTVLERESGEIVGRAGLFLSELLPEGVELGYLIRKDRRQRGYAWECCQAILAYASKVLEMETVHVLTDRNNEPSIRLARKLGFTEQGRIRPVTISGHCVGTEALEAQEWVHFTLIFCADMI